MNNLKAKLKEMSVKKKLDSYKICMIGIIIVLGLITIVLSMMTNAQMKKITEVWSPSLSRVQTLDNLTSTYRMRQYGHLVASSDKEILKYEEMLSETDKEISEVDKAFSKVVTLPKEKELLDEIRSKWATYKEQSEIVLEESRKHQTQKAGQLMVGEVFDTFNDFNQSFKELLALEEEEITKAKTNVNIMYGIMLSCVIIAIILGIILATFLSNTVTSIILEPIKQITEVSKRLYQGDMSAGEFITYESSDEFGIVAKSLKGAMKNLQNYIEEISDNLKEIAKGDLTKDSDEITDFIGDFDSIKESLIYILKRFNSTLTDIQSTSNQVAISSKEIAGASQTLADGSADQASAIEELTASIGTVAGLAEDSAKDTQEAYNNVRVSTERAEKEKEKMEELTREMARITEISKEIENIITAIEDIASQTNLLSLNASIEAARAGEAGRGFAVVADQIGKLASDSAESAVSTRELIQKTLVEIENGNAITISTSKAFDKIIDEMKEFAEIAQKTSETAKNQSVALEQIEQGIDQIAEVVQNTAASAEESTAISEDLSDEAVKLDELVKRFTLY